MKIEKTTDYCTLMIPKEVKKYLEKGKEKL